jgi:hypothetical protein
MPPDELTDRQALEKKSADLSSGRAIRFDVTAVVPYGDQRNRQGRSGSRPHGRSDAERARCLEDERPPLHGAYFDCFGTHSSCMDG